MSTREWSLTVDCTDAVLVSAFWAQALGYDPAPVPEGWASWDAWFDEFDVPVDERGGVRALVDPAGAGPRITFLWVPEAKAVKNRLHLDLRVSGGRHVDADLRTTRILAEVERLVALGATVQERFEHDGHLDHVLLADPEGNELCVV